ncbi:MAG: hypothetical protein ABI136_04270 [Ginsengibacter sp.]
MECKVGKGQVSIGEKYFFRNSKRTNNRNFYFMALEMEQFYRTRTRKKLMLPRKADIILSVVVVNDHRDTIIS